MGTNWKKNLAFTALLAVMGMATACTNAEQERTEADAEQAWTDFKSSAERAENDAQRNWDEATDEVRAETREWETDYDRNVARADSYSTRWDDNRKKEYETYKTRYRTADETRRTNYQTYEKRTKMSGSLLGGQQLSGMTPENATAKEMKKLKIAVFVKTFPAVSETFILSQVAYLLGQGHEVQIFATHHPPAEHKPHPLVEQLGLIAKTRHRPELPESLIARLLKGAGLITSGLAHVSKNLKALNALHYGRLAASLDLLYTAQPFLDKPKFDIIHCHFGPIGVKAAALHDMGLISGKLVVSFHGYDAMSSYILNRKGYYNQLIEKCDLFTGNSEFTLRKMQELGIPRQKMRCLPMGVDTAKFQRASPVNKPDTKAVCFISVGRLVEVKGFEYAIRAFAKVAAQYKSGQLQYLIVGYGPLQNSLEQLIEQLGLQHQVQLLGPKSQDEVKQLYETADVFVMPGIRASNGSEEAQGVVLLEAQAMELPVIASRVGGMPESIQEGQTGFLFPEKDTEQLTELMLKLAQNPAVRLELGKNGRHFVQQHFDNHVLGQKLESLYEGLL